MRSPTQLYGKEHADFSSSKRVSGRNFVVEFCVSTARAAALAVAVICVGAVAVICMGAVPVICTCTCMGASKPLYLRPGEQ